MKLFVACLVMLSAIAGCYHCKTPDCSDLPPEPPIPPMQTKDGGRD